MWDALLDSWLDLALGSSCVGCTRPGRVWCAACDDALPRTGVRVRPDPEPSGLAPVFAAGPYADPLRAIVLAHKEHRVFALAAPLGGLLATAVAAAVPVAAEDLLLVPVPSTPSTVRRRGHDPLARVVAAAGRVLRRSGYRVDPAPLLRGYRPVADQAGLAAGDRLENLDGSLAPAGRGLRRFAGRRTALVVCDDVITTGATAREAQRALEQIGLRTTAIAVVAATEKRRSLPICSHGG